MRTTMKLLSAALAVAAATVGTMAFVGMSHAEQIGAVDTVFK
jgi:CreA protein